MSVWRQGGDEAYIRIWGPVPPVSSRSMRPTLQIDCCVLQQHSVTGNSDVELYLNNQYYGYWLPKLEPKVQCRLPK